MVVLRCIFLCGDTAHLHKKVLPEVVLGEFHAAIRAPSQPGKVGKKRKHGDGMGLCGVVVKKVGGLWRNGGDDVSAEQKSVLIGQFGPGKRKGKKG